MASPDRICAQATSERRRGTAADFALSPRRRRIHDRSRPCCCCWNYGHTRSREQSAADRRKHLHDLASLALERFPRVLAGWEICCNYLITRAAFSRRLGEKRGNINLEDQTLNQRIQGSSPCAHQTKLAVTLVAIAVTRFSASARHARNSGSSSGLSRFTPQLFRPTRSPVLGRDGQAPVRFSLTTSGLTTPLRVASLQQRPPSLCRHGFCPYYKLRISFRHRISGSFRQIPLLCSLLQSFVTG
jgi:hypothetical protein